MKKISYKQSLLWILISFFVFSSLAQDEDLFDSDFEIKEITCETLPSAFEEYNQNIHAGNREVIKEEIAKTSGLLKQMAETSSFSWEVKKLAEKLDYFYSLILENEQLLSLRAQGLYKVFQKCFNSTEAHWGERDIESYEELDCGNLLSAFSSYSNDLILDRKSLESLIFRSYDFLKKASQEMNLQSEKWLNQVETLDELSFLLIESGGADIGLQIYDTMDKCLNPSENQ